MAGEVARAARWCARLEVATWTTTDVAAIAGVDADGARPQLRILKGRGVLVEVEPDRWRRGPAVAAWLAQRPKTRAGGHSRAYLAAKAVRDRLMTEDWHARRAAGVLTPTSADNSGQSRSMEDTMSKSIRRSASYLTLEEVAATMACDKRTIRRWVASGSLRVVRLSAKLVRVAADELERFTAERRQA